MEETLAQSGNLFLSGIAGENRGGGGCSHRFEPSVMSVSTTCSHRFDGLFSPVAPNRLLLILTEPFARVKFGSRPCLIDDHSAASKDVLNPSKFQPFSC
jgi:hypothetical protein